MTEVSQHVRILGGSERAALLPEVMHASAHARVADVGPAQRLCWRAIARRHLPRAGRSHALGRRFRPRM
ncbi:acetyltransferase [Xanthomonas citri pv. malvacearum]|uniref:Acetyltransferase n=1 Tax=Xanthomonas campestris pv. malvacearum TaxID=86040 RepID=A0AA44YZ53_XANCM|nr:acetyltransferase [Xanthomonas citri pv. malvacearum]NMI15011.1 acetyltransferase [Xanthomonas citri]ASN02277.1 acetyltransferase [Xanthomonas citri pv. malvacearum]ASY85465.1 acetyltransferase [Xanthomonas citri pv. malvacearum]ASY89670.1 acetyltransferase [Xanthomonas citri pv. malvacearum]